MINWRIAVSNMAGEQTLAGPTLKVIPQCTPTPPNQCPYQGSTFYTLRNTRNGPNKILKLIVTMTRSKVKSRSHHGVAHPKQGPYQVTTSCTLQFQRYCSDNILKVKVTTARSKVKSRSYHEVAHLQSPTSVPTK